MFSADLLRIFWLSYVATMNSDGSDFQKLPLDFAEHEIVLDIVPKDKGGIWTVIEQCALHRWHEVGKSPYEQRVY